MTITGLLEHIDGRKLTVAGETVVLRKGTDESQYLPLLQSTVELEYEEEKGFKMVKELRPSIPKTEVEKTKGPVDMPPSQNVPKLVFKQEGVAETKTTGPGGQVMSVSVPRSQKDRTITASWAMGAVLNSHALANANDAIALNTQQTVERAKKLAADLIKWVEDQSR